MNKLLDVNEAAELLRLKPKTIYTYVCKKKIPYIKLGARVLFNPEILEKWVDQHSVDTIASKIKNIN